MDRLRKPFFFASIILISIVVLVEIGSASVLGRFDTQFTAIASQLPEGEVRQALQDLDDSQRRELESLANQDKPPGFGIRYLALIDGILLFTVSLMGASLIIPERVHGRVQGVLTLIFCILIILLSIVLILLAVVALVLMVSLLLATPFGTLAYAALFGSFNRGGAAAILGLLMTLKLAFIACLVLAQQRFIQNKGLVFMIVTSLAGNVIVGFLHGFLPRFLASITDAISGIVVGIIAVIWAIILLVGAIVSIANVLRPNVA
jgi:hypothetical protein